MSESNLNELQSTMLAEARSEVQLADSKASLVLAALGIGFGAVLGGLLAGDWEPSDLEGIGEVVWWVGAILAAGSIAAAATAVWPRYDKSDVSDGIRYWGHVATFDSLDLYVSAAAEATGTKSEITTHQLWHLSRLVNKKYLCVRVAISLAGSGAFVLLLGNALGG